MYPDAGAWPPELKSWVWRAIPGAHGVDGGGIVSGRSIWLLRARQELRFNPPTLSRTYPDMHKQPLLLIALALCLSVCGSCAKEDVNAGDQAGSSLTREQLIEKEAIDLKGEVAMETGMGMGMGGLGTVMTITVNFTTDAGRKYELQTPGDTELVGITKSASGIDWKPGRRYKILGTPDGNTLTAIRIELISADTGK